MNLKAICLRKPLNAKLVFWFRQWFSLKVENDIVSIYPIKLL